MSLRSRNMKKGDRVRSTFKRLERYGRIASEPVRDILAGRCCLVRWDDLSESLCCTADLRRVPDEDVEVRL